jgi:uncharacterized coiled-coil DUF342 family protein
MEMTVQLTESQLNKLFQEFSKYETTAEYFARNLIRIEEIQSKIRSLEKEKCKAKADFDIKIDIINSQIKSIKEECVHELTTYYPDASGNNDSFYECDICGKEI